MATQADLNNAQLIQNSLNESEIYDQIAPAGITPEVLQGLKDLQGKTLEGIQLQKQNIKDTEAEFSSVLKRNPTVDLTPLASLVDAWTGSNFAGSYKPGFTGEQKNQLVKSYRQLLSNQKKELSESELALLKTKLTGQTALARAGGKGKELSQATILKLNEANVIPNTLDTLKTAIEEKSHLFGPVMGRMGQANPYDVEARSFDAEIRAASQQFGRYMEGGVLRKEDEEKYRRMFPNLSDVPEVAVNKLATVRQLLENKRQSDFAAFEAQGFSLAGIKKEKKTEETIAAPQQLSREQMIKDIAAKLSPTERAQLIGQ
jgi:hypothetical protein